MAVNTKVPVLPAVVSDHIVRMLKRKAQNELVFSSYREKRYRISASEARAMKKKAKKHMIRIYNLSKMRDVPFGVSKQRTRRRRRS